MVRNTLMPQMQLYDAPSGPNVGNFINPLMAGLKRGDDMRQQEFANERALALEARQGEQLNLAKNADTRAGDAQRMAKERAEVERLGKLAQVIADDPNDATASQRWQGVIQSNPQMGELLQKYGVNLNDHRTGANFLMAQVGSYMSPAQKELEKLKTDATRAQVGKLNAEAKALGQKDLVSELIMSQLRGGAAEPQSAAPGPIRPQSFNMPPGQDPNLIPVQSAAPATQQQQQQPDMIDTPYGRMTRDKARTVAGAMLLSPQYAQAGKALLDAAAAGASNLGKEAGNENDKKEMAALEGLQRVRQIASGFKPEWLTYENKAKQYGVSWADSFELTRKKLPPELVKDHVEYTMFKRDAISNLTQGIKDATGAAMGVQEEVRIRAGLPDPEKDNPTAFEAKIKGVAREYTLTIARTQYLRRNGFQGDGNAAALKLPVGQFSQMIQQRTNQLQQQIRQQNPQANPAQIQQAVKQGLQTEFGLGI